MPKTPAARSRGRPAKLSRDQILDCALKLIERSPGQKITMTGVAKALGTAPMSLYTHVKHRDDLMDGIAEKVMGQIDLELDPTAPWEDGVREWLNRCHKHLSGYPQVVPLLPEGNRIPPSWLRVHAPLIECLHRAGFRDAALAQASQWVAHQLLSALVMTMARPKSINMQKQLNAALGAISAEQQAIFKEILPHVTPDRKLFPYSVEQIILALKARLDAR
ncbi:AcrR family transcriptional regulator [Litorivivens lipolytica]|uniref:AcrR family transcriptional regulator n=1 Tax=Litorivivens lipolytica TaxID=1524264 RepID=A0A7W4W514_9GAMM|nr:TetR/AcrR family transcriptional regulator [Litorivivens lipolytica]MBB3047573.1 AcrR family transcriptional regulator [Litorivivens lipolytica]